MSPAFQMHPPVFLQMSHFCWGLPGRSWARLRGHGAVGCLCVLFWWKWGPALHSEPSPSAFTCSSSAGAGEGPRGDGPQPASWSSQVVPRRGEWVSALVPGGKEQEEALWMEVDLVCWRQKDWPSKTRWNGISSFFLSSFFFLKERFSSFIFREGKGGRKRGR